MFRCLLRVELNCTDKPIMWLFIISFWVKLKLGEEAFVEVGKPENTNIEFAALSRKSRTDCKGNPHTTPPTRFSKVLLTF